MTDFKQIAPVLEETPVTQRSPCYSVVSASLMNPLQDHSNYSPFCHTHYLILRVINTTVSWARPFTKPLRWRLKLYCRIQSGTHVFGACSALISISNRLIQADKTTDSSRLAASCINPLTAVSVYIRPDHFNCAK